MNPTDIVTLYKFGKVAEDLWNEAWHGGKEDFGSVLIQDSNSRLWKVKVRFTGYRKRYLKIKLESHGSLKIRASADNYKPGEYLRITPDEWHVFALLAKDNNERELYACARSIIDRLVR
ncbi:hypothetical protein [Floridanema aerugineum]|jgi:hypothetical protein|uniref:Uncharacterized protein n=1 Tax=Floridaenema aerugineum BLCC-F46 TaxID=3153654 RepID=A0ABV4XD78_9CYAN